MYLALPSYTNTIRLMGMKRKSVGNLCFKCVLNYFSGHQCKLHAIVFLDPPWEPHDPSYTTMNLEDKARFRRGVLILVGV